tara:strand:- start:112 stop:702 length:591 start_codon:yes stop_codon:yes gene_type:complete
MTKFSDEEIIAYLTGNIDKEKGNLLQKEMERSEDLKKRYTSFLDIYEQREQIVKKVISTEIPEETIHIFKKKTLSQSKSVFSIFKKGPIAGAGWAGFILTSGLLAFQTGPIQTVFRGNLENTQIANIDSEVTFRGLEKEIKESTDLAIGDKFNLNTETEIVEIEILSISDKNNEICVQLVLKSESETSKIQEICLK